MSKSKRLIEKCNDLIEGKLKFKKDTDNHMYAPIMIKGKEWVAIADKDGYAGVQDDFDKPSKVFQFPDKFKNQAAAKAALNSLRNVKSINDLKDAGLKKV